MKPNPIIKSSAKAAKRTDHNNLWQKKNGAKEINKKISIRTMENAFDMPWSMIDMLWQPESQDIIPS